MLNITWRWKIIASPMIGYDQALRPFGEKLISDGPGYLASRSPEALFKVGSY